MFKKNMTRFALVVFMMIILGSVVLNRFHKDELYSSDVTQAQMRKFSEVFYNVQRYYVEPADTEKLIDGAINGMLSELDPHSVYIPKKELERINERFQGSFEGIGIEFVILNKILTVVAPIIGGPSERAGLLPGDQIIKIEGKSAYGITNDEVQSQLRGEKGSKVIITIQRPGQSGTFDVEIIRDKIPIYSIAAAFMLDDNKTGYVYLSMFNQTTSDELEQALDKLENLGMEQLIFDLRGNSGGYLDQAWKVANKFIPGQQKIVYTKGRQEGSERNYFSTSSDTHPMYPVIVLIDHGSASASEIVSGAIQDLDRGLIAGQQSFGKGLVQNQIPLRDGSAMRLTTARYYTPSGRLIQRPYDDGVMDYYSDAYDDSSRAAETDSTEKYYTVSNRVVYGGGGITPDTTLVSEKITRFSYNLRTKRVFFEFGSQYASSHTAFPDFDEFNKSFKISDEMISDLKTIIKKQEIEYSQEAFDKDVDYIKMSMKAEVARHWWDREAYYKIRIGDDSEVQIAMGLMGEAEKISKLNPLNVN